MPIYKFIISKIHISDYIKGKYLWYCLIMSRRIFIIKTWKVTCYPCIPRKWVAIIKVWRHKLLYIRFAPGRFQWLLMNQLIFNTICKVVVRRCTWFNMTQECRHNYVHTGFTSAMFHCVIMNQLILTRYA